MPLRISAIISDYDGTLCPTASVKGANNQIPPDLEKVLWDISVAIPVCILSTKDFEFLRKKIQFAKIASCITGSEIFELAHVDSRSDHCTNAGTSNNNGLTAKSGLSNAICRYSVLGVNELIRNSQFLRKLSDSIVKDFQDISIEQKFTYVDGILAAITVDYRHIQKWEHYKSNIEPHILKSIQKLANSSPANDLFVQTYSDHPFIDVYSVKLDKGLAIDAIIKLLNLSKSQKVLYLGDSENDNPAFRRADLSVGIRSDERVKTKLDSDYVISFNELRPFLERLKAEDFVFNRMTQNIA